MPKNNEIEQLINGQVADANIVNQIILTAGTEDGIIPYSEDDHQRDTTGTESVGAQAYPWGSFYVNEDASLIEIDTVGGSISATVLFSNLRKWIYQKDTPASYSGNAGKIATVNSGESALTFFPSTFTGQAGKVLTVNAAASAFDLQDPLVKSSTIFSFSLGTGYANTNGVILSDSLVGANTEIKNLYWAVDSGNSTYYTVISSKWKKLIGVSIVTVHCRIWEKSNGNSAQCKVDIGGANNSVTGTVSQNTPEWKSFTIDVSGLTNGVEYDVTIQLANNQASVNDESYMDSIIAFGS